LEQYMLYIYICFFEAFFFNFVTWYCIVLLGFRGEVLILEV